MVPTYRNNARPHDSPLNQPRADHRRLPCPATHASTHAANSQCRCPVPVNSSTCTTPVAGPHPFAPKRLAAVHTFRRVLPSLVRAAPIKPCRQLTSFAPRPTPIFWHATTSKPSSISMGSSPRLEPLPPPSPHHHIFQRATMSKLCHFKYRLDMWACRLQAHMFGPSWTHPHLLARRHVKAQPLQRGLQPGAVAHDNVLDRDGPFGRPPRRWPCIGDQRGRLFLKAVILQNTLHAVHVDLQLGDLPHEPVHGACQVERSADDKANHAR
mmetsp:Transcript_38539/g.114392  ORF Transcript_38539/g.114392 Transcript_38539/m.114392 type:complete len:268 (+) Transcript_38539:668-1471(+)